MIAIRMLRSCLVDGEGRAAGERVKVSPIAAHEAVTYGWAEFVDDRDAEKARRAYVDDQQRMLARLNPGKWPTEWPDSPWRRV